MTEQEWWECTDPTPMLEFLRRKASDRKLWCFAVNCWRRVWSQLSDEDRDALMVADRFLDGSSSPDEMDACLNLNASPYSLPNHIVAEAASSIINRRDDPWWVARMSAENATPLALRHTTDEAITYCMEALAQALLLHDVMGNPFRTVTVDPRWLTSTVVDLATTIYDERAFDRMPILADALMDAGCDNETLIAHCRNEAMHVRGCWVVDLLLAKA